MKKKLYQIALSAGLMVAGTQMSFADGKQLTLSSWLPPTHPVVTEMIQPWAESIEKATDGRVKIKVLAKALGHPKVHYDIARDGLADISYSVHGYTPGRFNLTKIAELPFTGDSAEAISVAYWKIYDKYLTKANEHKGTQLLGLFTHGPGHIHNSKKDVKSLDDLKGMKVRIGGGVVNDVAKALGTVPLLKPASASYEILSRGVADGIFLPMESILAFKIQDIVKHTTKIPGGLYNTSFFLVMNPDSFKRLSEADQKAVMAASGETFAKLSGKVWDAYDAKATDALTANGNAVIEADEALLTDIKAKTSDLESAWIKSADEKGIDGNQVLEEFRQLIKDYQ